MKIGHLTVGEQPIFLAEIGLNHNGSIERAIQMIHAAKDAGCQIAKFQTFKASEFCKKDDPLYDTFKACELPDEAWPVLKRECDDAGVMFMSTPQNPSDLELLMKVGIPAIKVGSDDSCNFDLLRDYASHDLPLIVSTGMCDESDISKIEACLIGYSYLLMCCTSQYPCPPEEVNVSRIGVMEAFSDHTIGNTASIMACALGASVFERHFTLDKSLPGPDHAWACNPEELKSWVDSVREAFVMRGTGSFDLTEREAAQKAKYQRKSGQALRGEA